MLFARWTRCSPNSTCSYMHMSVQWLASHNIYIHMRLNVVTFQAQPDFRQKSKQTIYYYEMLRHKRSSPRMASAMVVPANVLQSIRITLHWNCVQIFYYYSCTSVHETSRLSSKFIKMLNLFAGEWQSYKRRSNFRFATVFFGQLNRAKPSAPFGIKWIFAQIFSTIRN